MPFTWDIFISYAREDVRIAESYYARLTAAGFRVFFAPVALPADADLQSALMQALRQSRNVVVIWTRFVEQSQWVNLEAALYSTARVAGSPTVGGILFIDLGGPRIPDWCACDRLLSKDEDYSLEELLRDPDWPKRQPDEPPVATRLSHLAKSILFDLAGWRERCRLALPRLSPGFSLAQVRPAEQERSLVKSLLGDAILLMLISCVVLGCASWVLGATVFANSYLPDWRGYVRREVLLVNSFALSAGLLISLRVGVAFGISASLLGGFFGSIAALAMGWFGRPGPVAGGVTAGVMLGACGALALLLPDRDQRPQTSEQFAWRAPAGLSVSLFLVAAIQMAAAELTSRLGDPAAGGRAAMATIVGGLLFSIFGGAAGWVAYGQQRGYFWRSAARFAFWVWCTFTLVTLIAAIFVPFGNPFTLADGVGVGLLSGAVFAGVLTVMTAFLKPVPAAASLLLIAWPLLHRFPNIEPDTVCRSLLVSSLVAFGVTLAAHRTTMPPAKPATAPQPSASAETRSQ